LPVFLLIVRLPPTSTLFPYTTLFRSVLEPRFVAVLGQHEAAFAGRETFLRLELAGGDALFPVVGIRVGLDGQFAVEPVLDLAVLDRKSTRLNSSHLGISYAVFCLKKK